MTTHIPANDAFKIKAPLISILVFAVMYPTVLTWVYFDILSQSSTAFQQAIYAIGKLLQFSCPIFFVLVAEKTHFTKPKIHIQDFQFGIVSGLAIMMLGYFTFQFFLKPSGLMVQTTVMIQQKTLGLGIQTKVHYFALSAFYSIGHAFLEEYYWRWFVFARLQKFFSTTTSLLIASFGFMAHHVIILGTFFGYDAPLTYIFALCVACGGALWSWQYHKFNSLLGPWISHCLVDAGIFLIGFQLLWP